MRWRSPRGRRSRRCRAPSGWPQLLDDQVVVLAGLDIGAVLADRLPDRLEGLGVGLLQVGHGAGTSAAPASITSSTKASRVPEVGGGPSTSILTSGSDGSIVLPGLVGVGDELAVRSGTSLASARNSCCLVSFDRRGILGLGDDRPSKPTFELDDVGDAVLGAVLELGLLDAARGVGESGVSTPTPAQNSFMPPPVPVELDDRGLHAGGLAELLGDRGGEGIDGRGADDADLVARGKGRHGGQRDKAGGREGCVSLSGLSCLKAGGT